MCKCNALYIFLLSHEIDLRVFIQCCKGKHLSSIWLIIGKLIFCLFGKIQRWYSQILHPELNHNFLFKKNNDFDLYILTNNFMPRYICTFFRSVHNSAHSELSLCLLTPMIDHLKNKTRRQKIPNMGTWVRTCCQTF